MTLSVEQKAERADRILKDEVFKEALERAREKKKREWTLASSTAERESIWHQYQALDAVEVALKAIYQDGYVAQHQREKRERNS